MSYNATVLKVMIASPSDVTHERSIIKEVLYEWNTIYSESKNIVLLPVSWETHSSPEMGNHPQEIINKQVLKNCDILVGVFWTRIGTSTENYSSGTVEEIEEHIKADKLAMLYFSSAPVHPDSVDSEQYKNLKEFKMSCQTRGLYKTYSDLNEFKNEFYHHLQIQLNSDKYSNLGQNTNIKSTVQNTSIPNIPSLSNEAKILLKEGSEDSNGVIVHLDSISGMQMQSNNKEIFSGNDPKQSAIWKGALEELISNGLIKDKGHKRQIFELTRKGYDIAELL